MPDFTVKNRIDPQAFANVIQRKAQIEQQAVQRQREFKLREKESRTNRLLQAIQMGGSIVTNMMAFSKQKQEKEALDNFAKLAGQEFIPTAESSVVGEGQPFGVKPTLEQTRQQKLAESIARIAPKEFAKSKLTGTGGPSLLDQQRLLNIQKTQRELSTEGPQVDSLKEVLVESDDFTSDELDGLSTAELTNLSNQSYRQKIAGARADMASTMQARLKESVSKTNMSEAIKIGNRINPAASNDVTIRRERIRLGNAAQLGVLAQAFKGKATIQEIREASTALAGLVMGGGTTGRVAKEQIDELTPKALIGDFQKQVQYITGRPRDAKMKAFLSRMTKTAIREAREAEQNIRQAQVGLVKNAQVLKERSPQAYQAVIDAGNLSDSKIRGNRYIIDDDYNSILPLFNPFKLTAEGIISGQQPLTIDLNEARKMSELPFKEENGSGGLDIDFSAVDAEIKRRGL